MRAVAAQVALLLATWASPEGIEAPQVRLQHLMLDLTSPSFLHVRMSVPKGDNVSVLLLFFGEGPEADADKRTGRCWVGWGDFGRRLLIDPKSAVFEYARCA